MKTLPKMRSVSRSGGSSIVEFALVLPVFLIIVFGVIDFARHAYLKHAMTHVAKQGLRVGFTGRQLPSDADPQVKLSRYYSIVKGVRDERNKLFSNVLTINNTGGGGSDNLFVEFSSNNGASWATGAGAHKDMIRVRIRQSFRFITPFISLALKGNNNQEYQLEVAMVQRNLGNPDSYNTSGAP